MKTILMLLLLSGTAFAQTEDYLQCGPPPGLFSKLLTDAEEIRLKCIDDIYEKNQERVRKEVLELTEVRKKLDQEILETAITSTLSTVQCAPKQGQKRDQKLVTRCQDAVRARNGVIDRIDKLMGWKSQHATKPKSDAPKSDRLKEPSEFPCPGQAELDQMRVARAFNKRLNEMWTRCMVDNQL